MLLKYMIQKSINRVLLFLILSALTGVPGYEARAGESADPACAAGFVPHRALYDIQLSKTKNGSQIINISGQMFYEWASTTDAWTSNHRFSILYEYADSPALRITSDFSTYESFDGRRFNFSSHRRQDGTLFEELRGSGVLDETGRGRAVYSHPAALEFDLPSGTVFPMAHSLEIARRIKNKDSFYSAVIFDGSDENGPVEVNSFIGAVAGIPPALKNAPAVDMSLLEAPAHRLRLAFFPLNAPSSTPDYEMSLLFHDNGVISDMIIEYEDFTISQKLLALESLSGSCGVSKKDATANQ